MGVSDIIEFQVHSKIYVSVVVQSEQSSVKTHELDHSPSLQISTDSTFLLTLVRGARSLYFNRGEAGNENFYIPGDYGFDLLVYKRYINDADGNISENKKYIGQLALYLRDCREIQSLLKDLSYTQHSLMNLFQKYFSCVSSTPDHLKIKEKRKPDIGALVGLSMTTLDFKGTGYRYLVDTDYDLSVNLAMGLFFNARLAGNQGKWSISNELMLAFYECEGEYTDYENEDKYSIISTAIGSGFLRINSMIRYTYPVKKLQPYVNAGFSVGLVFMQSNDKRTYTKFYSSEKVERDEALGAFRNYELSCLAGIGARYGRFHLESRYERGNGMSEYSGIKSITQRIYILLGYRF